jgi:hypothetical protein
MEQSRFTIDSELLYTVEYANKPDTIELLGFELPVPLPVKPKKSTMMNYGKPKHQQKFHRELIPDDIKMWPKRAVDEFVSVMWHKRRNGEWWLIGGQEVYITGKAWTFFNFWYTEKGTLPDFRMEAVEFFLVWEFMERDKNCLGMLDIKPRRIGDTEKTVFILWEYCSRVRNQRGGMQNVKDDAAEKNFKRLVKGHTKMIWFFKPFLKGSDAPSQSLEFMYPEQRMTRKKITTEKRGGGVSKILDSNFKFKPIESSIDFEASVQGRYDGERLGRFHLDEPGKIMAFNIKEQWPVIRRTLTLNNDRLVVGKAIWTTTVEDYKKGKKSGETMSTMTNIKWFWTHSNPRKIDANSRTITGLWRYFRSCIMSDDPDEFGFYNELKTMETIHINRKSLEEIGDWEGLAQFKRQYPLTIADVFTLPIDDCVLMPVLLDRRKIQIEEGQDWKGHIPPDKGPIKPIEVRGSLVWVGGEFGGQVDFYPDPTGRWYISQFPLRKNYRTIVTKGIYKPGNDDIYSFGVDPYDHMVEGRAGEDGSPIHSEGAGVVYRKYDESVDGHLERDEYGEIEESEVSKMKTDTFVCVYLNRPQDPYEFYEDMLKTSIYYGVQMFYEKDKPGVGQFFRNTKKDGQSFGTYLKDRPKETRTEFGSKKKEKGTKASAPVISLYVDALKWHVIHRIWNYHHISILDDFRKFKIYNRTECDLTVAAGFALLAAGPVTKKRIEEKREEVNQNISYFRKYNRKR